MNLLNSLISELHFFKIVATRFFIILFRRRKSIELLQLDYDEEHIFEKSYIVINYRFRNALYYRFGKYRTLQKQIKIFDLQNFDKEFDFIVYGFFQKKKYKLRFEPKLKLNSSSFKTTLLNLSLRLEEKPIPKLTPSLFFCVIKKPIIITTEIKLNQTKIKISNTTFNQTDYI
jgi:hypothetical protein